MNTDDTSLLRGKNILHTFKECLGTDEAWDVGHVLK